MGGRPAPSRRAAAGPARPGTGSSAAGRISQRAPIERHRCVRVLVAAAAAWYVAPAGCAPGQQCRCLTRRCSRRRGRGASGCVRLGRAAQSALYPALGAPQLSLSVRRTGYCRAECVVVGGARVWPSASGAGKLGLGRRAGPSARRPRHGGSRRESGAPRAGPLSIRVGAGPGLAGKVRRSSGAGVTCAAARAPGASSRQCRAPPAGSAA
jgi:hypothetical protein